MRGAGGTGRAYAVQCAGNRGPEGKRLPTAIPTLTRHTREAIVDRGGGEADERRAALREYVATQARGRPPVFAGRGKVVRAIEGNAEAALGAWRAGDRVPGLTQVVQGAPGAGKSALLAHLERKWDRARRAGDPGVPIAVNLPVPDLADRRALPRALRAALPGRAGEEWVPAVVGGLASMLASETVGEVASDAARKLFEGDGFRHPLVLMVDEAQEIRPRHREAGIVQKLHQGHTHGIPVLPVLAGLGHLREHLGRPGIGLSRFSNELESIHTLGPLSDGEVRELFVAWLDHFGVAAPRAEAARWSETLVRDSQGWPMHTNHFLATLARRLAAPGRDPGRLDTADLGPVRRGAAERRVAYYNTRYDGPLLGKGVRNVAEVMATLRNVGPATREGTCNVIADAFGHRDPQAAENVFKLLLARGFLQESTPKRGGLTPRVGADPFYDCPIPSLASYASVREFPPHLAATLGDSALLGRRLQADPGEVGTRDVIGRTPLQVAAEYRWTDAAETLLAAGADADAPDAAGATARGIWPEFDWPKRAPEKNHDNGGGSGASGGPGGRG